MCTEVVCVNAQHIYNQNDNCMEIVRQVRSKKDGYMEKFVYRNGKHGIIESIMWKKVAKK